MSIARPHPKSSPTTALVQATWADVLGLDSLGPHDDFFELGGSSLMVASAVARLAERLGLDLPPRALFEAPTPAEMAELIAERRDGRGQPSPGGITPFIPDWVVPLQREGAGRPVFVFPIVHDEIRALAAEAQMAAHVGRAHPFWGFRRDVPPLASARAEGVPTLAAAYLTQMRTMQAEGPYLLYGNCAGGYLAWEVARQLIVAGEGVAGILFYEVPLRTDFADLLPGFTPAGATPELRLSRDYRPQSLPVDLTFLMTDDWQARGWWPPWQDVTRGTFEAVVIPLETLGVEDFIARRNEIIAAHVRDWIARAEARVSGA